MGGVTIEWGQLSGKDRMNERELQITSPMGWNKFSGVPNTETRNEYVLHVRGREPGKATGDIAKPHLPKIERHNRNSHQGPAMESNIRLARPRIYERQSTLMRTAVTVLNRRYLRMRGNWGQRSLPK